MARILQHLQDDQAILLMYLADELPAEDRAAVEQRLAADPRLTEELEKMRQTHEAYVAAMRQLDERSAEPISQAAALRQVSRLIRQWQAQRLAQPSPAARRRGLPLWVYPLAAAAVVVVAITSAVWMGTRPSHDTAIIHPTPAVDPQQQGIALLDKSLGDDPAEVASAQPTEPDDAESLLPWDPSFVGVLQK